MGDKNFDISAPAGSGEELEINRRLVSILQQIQDLERVGSGLFDQANTFTNVLSFTNQLMDLVLAGGGSVKWIGNDAFTSMKTGWDSGDAAVENTNLFCVVSSGPFVYAEIKQGIIWHLYEQIRTAYRGGRATFTDLD